MKKIIGIIIISLFIGVSLNSVSSLETEAINIQTQDDAFDRIIERIMDFGHFPSISACIIKGDEIVWSKGYGLSNIESSISATDETVYSICSITKTITGTALMQLYDQGLFELDDDVNEYLPFSLRNPNFPEVPITFRMLLSHSSSLRTPFSYWNIQFYTYGGPPFQDYPMPWLEESLTPEGDIYVSAYWDTENMPGQSSVYANVNFDLIGYLVELLSNEPFYEYCDEHIFKPLEMYDSGFNLSIYPLDKIAIPYNWNDANEVYRTSYNQVHNHYPAGGLFSSVKDMSHFMIAHMNGGVFNGTRILEESTIAEMHTIQPNGSGYGRAFGLAWMYESRSLNLGSNTIYLPRNIYGGHGGAVTFGFRTTMQMKLSENVAIIFFINSDSFIYQDGWNGLQFLRELLFLKANDY